MKEKFFARYFELYKTFLQKVLQFFWNTGDYTKILTKIQLSGRYDHLEPSGKD